MVWLLAVRKPKGSIVGYSARVTQTSDPAFASATAHTLLRGHLVAMIRDGGPISRSQLSRAIGLPRSTTTALVAELLREGLIDEAPARSGGAGSGSGRPATLLSLHRPDGIVAGFDFGHRHIRVAVATSEGQILAEESTPLDVDRRADSALDLARELLSVVLDAQRAQSFLLVLDAMSLAEIAKEECPHHIPFGFHGNYFPA